MNFDAERSVAEYLRSSRRRRNEEPIAGGSRISRKIGLMRYYGSILEQAIRPFIRFVSLGKFCVIVELILLYITSSDTSKI